jgi:hypothetical protein
VHMLNRYFTAAAEPVLNNGFIDKYIGDGILAVFGTRDESPGTACRNAVRAALGMVEAVRRRGPTFERELTACRRWWGDCARRGSDTPITGSSGTTTTRFQALSSGP